MQYIKYIETQSATNVWVENIPNHWSEKRLCFMIKTIKGFAFKSELFTSSGILVVKASDIKNKTIIKSDIFLPESFFKTHKQVLLSEGDIIISTVGSAPDVKNSAVGQIGRVPKSCVGSLLNQNTVILRPESDIDNDYLLYILSSNEFREHLDLHAHGTANQASISLSDILNFTAILPPPKEQRKIAVFLDFKTRKIDQLIKRKKVLIEKLEEKRIAVIAQAVTKGLDENAKLKSSGVDWLGEVPEHWDVRKLKFMASIKNGRDYKEVEIEEGGYPIFGSGGEFKRSSQYFYEGESVLFGRKGTIDKPLYVNCRFWTVDTMFYSKVHTNTIARFLYYSALTFQYEKLATQTALPSITQNDLENYVLTYPCKEEQMLIVNYLDEQSIKIKEMIAVNKKAIEKLEEYRSAIITSTVTGQIDVREIDIPKEVV